MDSRVTEFHSIMPIANIPSVLQRGILSHERSAKLRHADISMTLIQKRRDHVTVPGGTKLHKYANVYFHARNPMLYKRKDIAAKLCILKISTDILGLDSTIISDQNASSDYVWFLPPAAIDMLDFDDIYAQDWGHSDKVQYWRQKSRKCAEVLVPNVIEPRYIMGAYVVNSSPKYFSKIQDFPCLLPSMLICFLLNLRP